VVSCHIFILTPIPGNTNLTDCGVNDKGLNTWAVCVVITVPLFGFEDDPCGSQLTYNIGIPDVEETPV